MVPNLDRELSSFVQSNFRRCGSQVSKWFGVETWICPPAIGSIMRWNCCFATTAALHLFWDVKHFMPRFQSSNLFSSSFVFSFGFLHSGNRCLAACGSWLQTCSLGFFFCWKPTLLAEDCVYRTRMLFVIRGSIWMPRCIVPIIGFFANCAV